jgi:hypothetical protein
MEAKMQDEKEKNTEEEQVEGQEGDRVVASVLTTKATASLRESVEADLEVEDPDEEKAKAFLLKETE